MTNTETNTEQLKEWKETVYPALLSKTEEFHLLGYDQATTEEIWECLIAKLERRNEEYQLHQFVSEILRMSANEYMNWLTISAYKGPDWFGDNASPLNLSSFE